jgi:aquaporin Z
MMHSGAGPDFLDPRLEGRRLFAELWGTFLLVLVACGGSVVSRTTTDLNPALAAAAPGLMVMAVIYFMGSVSGAHLNPAVTLAFAVRRNFPWRRVPGYLVAQIGGAIAAAFFVSRIFGPVAHVGATLPRPGLATSACLALEIVLTAGLVNTILGTASGARNIGPNGALAVGGYIALAGLWAGPICGASMNPARSLGPDVVRGNWHTTWIYVAGPLIGAMIGVVFEWILKGPPTTEGTRAAQGEDGLAR